jgi:hypothetical protein
MKLKSQFSETYFRVVFDKTRRYSVSGGRIYVVRSYVNGVMEDLDIILQQIMISIVAKSSLSALVVTYS